MAITNAYKFLSPDLWPEQEFTKNPLQEHTDYLAKAK